VVHKATRIGSGEQGFWNFGANADTRYPNSIDKIVDNFGSNTPWTSPATNGLDKYHLYEVIATSSGWTNRINGTNFFSVSPNTLSFPGAPVLGKGSTKYFAGNIAEILIFTNVVSGDATNTVKRYLKDKYNLNYP
jgi:hypothetical protein